MLDPNKKQILITLTTQEYELLLKIQQSSQTPIKKVTPFTTWLVQTTIQQWGKHLGLL